MSVPRAVVTSRGRLACVYVGMTGLAKYRHLILPASLPSFISGLKQGWAFSWRSLMAGELLVIIADAAQNAMAGEYRSITDGLILVSTIIASYNLAATLMQAGMSRAEMALAVDDPFHGRGVGSILMEHLAEAAAEQRFRPDRGCHTALSAVQRSWTGVKWFVEGDIKGCFERASCYSSQAPGRASLPARRARSGESSAAVMHPPSPAPR